MSLKAPAIRRLVVVYRRRKENQNAADTSNEIPVWAALCLILLPLLVFLGFRFGP